MQVCGPKLSLCGIILSVWGIIQLVSVKRVPFLFFFRCCCSRSHISLWLEVSYTSNKTKQIKMKWKLCVGRFVSMSKKIKWKISRLFFSFQQTLMGMFYYMHSVALIEDLPLNHTYTDPAEFYVQADIAYTQVRIFYKKNTHPHTSRSRKKIDFSWMHYFVLGWIQFHCLSNFTNFDIIRSCSWNVSFQNAHNCWIAALIYVATLVFSAQQFYTINRAAA